MSVSFTGCDDYYHFYMSGNGKHQPMGFFTLMLSFRKLNGLLGSSPLGVLDSVFCFVLSFPGFLSLAIVSVKQKKKRRNHMSLWQ